MKVLIVGGGIGGLTLGASLNRHVVAYRIVERTSEWAPLGAGIGLGINAMRVLHDLGLGERVASEGRVAGEARIADFRGRLLSRLDLGDLREDLGESILIHRAKLHEALLNGNDEACITLGTTADGMEEHDLGVDVTFDSGEVETFDVVVGADGLRSQVRSLVFGEFPLRYSGYTCWRFVVEGDFEDVGAWELWGRGQRFGIVPLGGREVYCFSCLNAPRNSEEMRTLSVSGFKELFGSFQGPVPQILDRLEAHSTLIWNDLEEVVVPSWVKGRVALLGDAAHGMTPNMGQGAAMAIEDAFVLSRELRESSSVEEALRRYEGLRRGRVTRVQDQSRRIGRVAQWESRLLCGLRNFGMRMTPKSAAIGAIRNLVDVSI